MRLALLALVTGCSFSGAQIAATDTVDASATGTPTPDAPDVVPTPDAPTSHLAPCATTDVTGLIACYEFEDDFAADGTIHDSSANHLDAMAHGLAVATHATADQAAAVTPGVSTYVPQIPVLDRATGFTLAMWVKPSALPSEGGVMGLLDHEDQYAMDLGKSGGSVTMRCILTGLDFYEWVDGISANTWSMFACTWDGDQVCAYRWTSASSHSSNCFSPGMPAAPTGSHGLAIGSLSDKGLPTFPLSGALDGIHIYNHALTESGLCQAVGQSGGCM